MSLAVSTSDLSPQPIASDTGDKTARIRALNDQFRTATMADAQHLGRRVFTSGVWALGPAACFDILCKVRGFKDFTEANDPWNEHDFGAFDYKGQKIYWKIDYYDKACAAGSPDPTDPAVTCRVLTVLLADEY